ncbi:hypothetical protein Palpr_2326 [Paludibacter propionicigenes WB4]|uniref:BioF2-like acetyltransferase domain-containing protein n=1 Tax=Paludibacter propionicigenes (strain DSM 17365 / JCM 13257 / WB4) TaxID=694427 RepID=E4T6W7_PALPW|nr:GNAT family N-acetyltransferase [Paludibacter propionicigenes]ADQ80461.1 hypothetical protein Palpr_2326 [Paludibacter propionicigenes WB4]
MLTFESFNGIPVDYELFLIEEYASFITTCRYIEVNYPDFDINYFTVKENGKLIELLVYGNKGNTATCFNSLVSIDENIISEFTKKLFIKHPTISKIEIVASYKDYTLKKSFLSFKSDDQILKLPSTLDEYYQKLNYHVRKNSKNRKNRFLREFPMAKFETKYGSEIDESIVDKILLLNSNRMQSKGTVFGIDNAFKDSICKYSTFYGCVAYIEIDGEIVAGCISTILNKNIFAHVIGHDNNYSNFNLGEMCFIYLIETSINKGLSTFHFLWGQTEYKRRLLAEPHLLFFYYIYRSYSANYMVDKVKGLISATTSKIRQSNYSKPIRDGIKNYRKKKIQKQMN